MAWFGIILFVLFGFGAIMLILGWIVPLVIASSLKRNGVANVRGWRVFAAIWGTVAALTVFGGFCAYYMAVGRDSQSYEDSSSDDKFDPVKYNGATSTVKTSYSGESSFTASVDGKDSKTFQTTNGIYTVPAGRLNITRYSIRGFDSNNVKWTISSKLGQGTNVQVIAGIENTLILGQPFTAGVQMTWSAASKQVDLSPVYMDSYENEVQLTSESKEATGFEFLDASGNVVWSGKFVAG